MGARRDKKAGKYAMRISKKNERKKKEILFRKFKK
jgi:hypothetical protein